jgi:hypothetical protein
MKTNILVLLLLSIATTSCKKVTNVEVVAPFDSGSFKYQLTDGAGKGVANLKVQAYKARENQGIHYIEEGDYSDTARTNAQGIVVFPKLKADNYILKCNNILLNKLHYFTTEYVQVVAGVEKSKVTRIPDFSGQVNIKLITDMSPNSKLPNYGIALVENHPDLFGDGLKKALDAAVVKGMTDSNGLVSFTIPSDVSYYTLIYRPDKSKIKLLNDVHILSKGDVRTATVHAGDYDE